MVFKNYRHKLAALTALFITSFALAVVSFSLSPTNAEIVIKRLGNPLLSDGFDSRALNVWDLQAFDGKIYLGGGSTVDNVGPVNVWAYDPETKEFIKEFTVKEEAIEHYRVYNDQLYIPAADPTQDDLHKFYRREDNQWQQYDSPVVKLAHVRDLIETNTKDILMVGNNRQMKDSSSKGTIIAIPTQDGLKFQPSGVNNIPPQNVILADYNWFFSVFRYQDRIFSTNSLLRDAENYSGAIAEYDPILHQFSLNFDFRNDEFIPENIINGKKKQGLEVIYRPWNPVEFQDYLVYPVRSYSISKSNYHAAYMNSIGCFIKSAMGVSPLALNLPNKALGEDVLVVNDQLYVLANRKDQEDNFAVYVYKTDRLEQKIEWQEVLQFSGANKARSFEYLDGTFYFGLGQDYGEAIANSGDILSYTPQ